ncbi:DNA-directed RNA polymerase I subunit rpa1 [Auxenochlorella protothecoides]|uniref:DNA-directed RNA polymerase subunit n=1 Tax=Auxenochlorella protothecoides TaxID=3075 RepID=A0A087SNI7_AUXPR|nr:DNA-directed RNA polymerase I subunit rpa1 [Auxenochlorella protothecoides]KFM27291.1 DNA-directed RNA polymerase I subunit rpa1 [Auxenochlorella protothecoides]
MNSSLHTKEVTTAKVRSVGFGFFSDDEIRKVSVKKIISPIIFDNSKTPVEGGLYDTALGPLDPRERCTTCGLTADCPGHFGHVELAVPVYNPLVFGTLYKLLRCACLHCFKMRMASKEVQRYVARLSLLLEGRLAEAQGINVGASSSARKAAGKEGMELDEGSGGEGSPTSVVKGPLPSRRTVAMTGQSLEAAIDTMSEIFKKQPPGRCANCGAHSPSIKKEGYSKLFLLPLTTKKAAANKMQGTEILPSLSRLQAGNLTLDEAAGLGSQGCEEEAKVRYGFLKEEKEGLSDEEVMAEFKESKHGDEGGVFAAELPRAEVPRQLKGVPASEKENASNVSVGPPKFLTAAEVQEILRCVWVANADIMQLIYPADVAQRKRRQGASEAQAAAAGKAAAQAGNYREFFIQTVAVTPNRFRPISHVGEMVYEHPQNTMLVKVLNANLEIQRLAAETDQDGEPLDITDGRMLRTWLEMQNSVNAFIDSTTAENEPNAIVRGIRQQLEKKEGLFRKNMMGKRVNFAARSVISPDVYLNGGEIGVPPYIAARLTFPERVTPWNVERLCEAVMAGPGRNPGAVAVENEKGRLLMLRDDAKVVYRSMEDGDVLLTNRQPTLHKPGMMAHRARIMRDERTIRFHYANCATFNADFDGDEINLHLPQDQLGRAEGYGIVSADHQFFVPTDGKPLRGLIQDHIVAGTLLTLRDRFFTAAQYHQLVYEAVCTDCSGAWEVWLDEPALVKPVRRWTGKQVLTAVLMHYTRDQLPFSMSTASRVPVEAWGKNSGEGKLLIQHNHVLAGCVDKNCFGKHGLLHFFHELYGAERTSLLTASLSRLLTGFLQKHGFTCGMSDVLLVQDAEEERKKLLTSADVRCLDAAASLFGPSRAGPLAEQGMSYEEAFRSAEPDVREQLRDRFRSNQETGALLDMKSSSAMHPLSSDVVRACLPGGQEKAFRHNMMALMTVTGAKGSLVNFSQISCLLGQQELEGRRVPRMASGKTLPCFAPFDVGARSGGYVGDRFLSGLRPQEYYFHCMAGREGLVDTTVKTSRSGYIQRCLVKNLEPLRVAYDSTVRDDTDSSIVQFHYGEDGIDTTRTGCLRTLPFFYGNMPQLGKILGAATALSGPGLVGNPSKEQGEATGVVRSWSKALLAGKSKTMAKCLPADSVVSHDTLGVTSEGFQGALAEAMYGGGLRPPVGPEPLGKDYKRAGKKEARCLSKNKPWSFTPLDPMDFTRLMQLRFQQCQAAPGEAVGVLAAQSVGEPSTQMTLNTFHMAGRGEANVTLGIPRLREILMTASPTLATPVEEDALARSSAVDGGRARVARVTLRFHPPHAYPPELGLGFEELAAAFRDVFVPRFQAAVKAEIRRASTGNALGPVAEAEEPESEEDEEGKTRFGAGRGEHATYDAGDEDDAALAAQAQRQAAEREGLAEEEEGGEETGPGADEESRGATASADAEAEEGWAAAPSPAVPRSAASASGAARRTSASASSRVELEGGVWVDAATSSCGLALHLALDCPKLLLQEVAERVAAAAVLRGTPGVSRCYVLEAARGAAACVQTDGINLRAAAASADLVDVDGLAANSPYAMLETYGVEAARATIVREAASVFGAYGIGVDPRHLALIADYMTHLGGYRACNRLGISASTSPFLKVTFETAASFLVSSTLHGDVDRLTSPASRIVLGQPVAMGTGAMDLVQHLDAAR